MQIAANLKKKKFLLNNLTKNFHEILIFNTREYINQLICHKNFELIFYQPRLVW